MFFILPESMLYVQKLQNYLSEKGINAELIEVKKAATVKEAAEELGCSRREIIKSVVFVAENKPVIAIVDGASSVNKKRIEKILGKKVRIADRHKVEELTGYPAGGVPPVGHNCRIIVDERVIKNEMVYGGGGDENHLLLIPASYLIKEGEVMKIRK